MKAKSITVYGHPDVDASEDKINQLLIEVGGKGKIVNTSVAVGRDSENPWAMVVLWYEPR